jgi:hypothetical protein
MLAMLSLLAATPRWLQGTNIVTEVYRQAALRLWRGQSPYSATLPDLFLYSPAFGLSYGTIAWLPSVVQAVVWGILNGVVFWVGIAMWMPNRRLDSLERFGLLFTAVELNCTLLYQQVNALLAGVLLIALAHARNQDWKPSGMWMATSLFVKPLAWIFLLAFMPRPSRNFWTAFSIAALCFLLLPICILGPADWWKISFEWILAMWNRTQHDRGQLDISSVFRRLQWPFGTALEVAVVLATLGLWLAKIRRGEGFQASMIALALCAVVLSCPTAETATFAVFAPAYFLSASDSQQRSAFWVIGWTVAAALTTIVFTDVWPRHLHRLSPVLKTLGVGILWGTIWIAEVRREATQSRILASR